MLFLKQNKQTTSPPQTKTKKPCPLSSFDNVCWHFLLVNTPASGRFLPFFFSCPPSPSQIPKYVDITNSSKSLSKVATFTSLPSEDRWFYNCIQNQLMSHVGKWFSLIDDHPSFLSKPMWSHLIHKLWLYVIFKNNCVYNLNDLSRVRLCHHWGYYKEGTLSFQKRALHFPSHEWFLSHLLPKRIWMSQAKTRA